MKMLLHACCGPCSLEPTRLLMERGVDITIAYVNSNIAPLDEYQKRLVELKTYAESVGLSVIEGDYQPSAWEDTAGVIGEHLSSECDIFDLSREVNTVSELLNDEKRQARCRACYRQRLEEAAHMAQASGFDTLATTLAVSPYQFTDVIHEELERAASTAGLEPYFEDWRPHYDNATARSRALGMYRQNYCGCRFSIAEGEATRAFIRHQKTKRKQKQHNANAQERAEAEATRKQKAAERSAYNQKQAQKRAVLKALREQRATEKNSRDE